jgi:hypothetical protein
MDQAAVTADPFSAYIGRRVLLRHAPVEIVRTEVRCRRVCFIGKDASGQEVFLPLDLVLEELIDEESPLTRVLESD